MLWIMVFVPHGKKAKQKRANVARQERGQLLSPALRQGMIDALKRMTSGTGDEEECGVTQEQDHATQLEAEEQVIEQEDDSMRFTFTIETKNGAVTTIEVDARSWKEAEEKVKRENPTCTVVRVETK